MPAYDSMDLLTRVTKREMTMAYVAYARCEKGEGTTAEELAGHFKDCSTDLALSILHGAKDAGAVEHEKGNWRPTEACIGAMRVYFRDFNEAHPEVDAA